MCHKCCTVCTAHGSFPPASRGERLKPEVMLQVRTYDLVQKDKIFAIGYCFGGGAVLELMRSWPATTGLLGEHQPSEILYMFVAKACSYVHLGMLCVLYVLW